LPLTGNDGKPVNPEKFRQTREELLGRFQGVSTLPGTLEGIWVHAGIRYEDESVRLSVDVPPTKKNRQFFVNLKAKLMKRFEQVEIYIASYSVDIL